MSPQGAADKSEDGQVCNLKFSCFTTTVVININKQYVNIADEILTVMLHIVYTQHPPY